MIKVQEIQAAIEALPHGDYARLRQWSTQRDWKQWDKQIETHSQAGKLDFLLKEAAADKAAGRLREL
jgi:hypothetical protein